MARKKLPNAVAFDPRPAIEGQSRVPLLITSVVIDKMAGASLVDNVWGTDINGDFIVSRLHSNSGLRARLSEMLCNGSMTKVFVAIIESRTFRTGGIQATITEVFDACKAVSDSEVAPLLTEFAVPLLAANGLVTGNSKFAVRRKVKYASVTVEAISQDLLRQEISGAVAQAKQRFVLPSGQHATKAIAEVFADALRPVGIALNMINNYENVLQDIVLGVLANIDPAPLNSQRGSVPEDLRSHSVVQQLMSCWTFIDAALTLRADVSGLVGPSAGVKTSTSQYTFDKHAPVVLTMIRSSERFALVSKDYFRGAVGFKKVFDLKGRPVSTVLFDATGVEAAAMAVIKVDDVMLENAVSLQELPDRISERMIAAYGDLPSWMSIPQAAAMLHDVVTYKVESGETVDPMYSCRVSEVANVVDKRILAAMFAERVSACYVMDAGDAVSSAGYDLVYSGATEYQDIELKSGKIISKTYFSADPTEVFLCLPETMATRSLDVPPQLIPRSAMQSRLIGYDETDFVVTAKRGGYMINALDVELKGVIRLKEMTSIRMGDLAALVSPYHNSQVFREISDTIETALDLAESIVEPISKRRATKAIAQYVIKTAQAISPSFRSEIHQAIVEQAAKTVSYDESIQLRAKLRQGAMAAAADIVAMSIFLRVQGIVGDDVNIIDTLNKNKTVVDHWLEFGTDRDK